MRSLNKLQLKRVFQLRSESVLVSGVLLYGDVEELSGLRLRWTR